MDFQVEIPINVHTIPSEYWPEAPTPTSLVVYGQEAIVSFNLKQLTSQRPAPSE